MKNTRFKCKSIFDSNLTNLCQRNEKTIDLELQHQVKMSDILYEINGNILHKIDPKFDRSTSKLRSMKVSTRLIKNKFNYVNSNTFFKNQRLVALNYNRNLSINNKIFDKKILKTDNLHTSTQLNVTDNNNFLGITNDSQNQSQSVESISSEFSEIENHHHVSIEIDANIEEDECKTIKIDDHSEHSENYESAFSHGSAQQPVGLPNAKDNRFLNSIVQMFAACLEVRTAIEENKFVLSKNKDYQFIQGFFDLIQSLKSGNKQTTNKAHFHVQNYINETFRDDPYKCIMNILKNLNNASNQEAETFFNKSQLNTVDDAFENLKPKTPNFMLNYFYGEIVFRVFCSNCGTSCKENLQTLKSLFFPVFISQSTVSIQEYVKGFFKDSVVESNEFVKCHCGSTNFISDTKLTHAPKYLFIYLSRSSCISSVRNVSLTLCSNIEIESKQEKIFYKLISVIDHKVINFTSHYCCKCTYRWNKWWLLEDEDVTELSRDEISSKYSIIFLYKRYF